MIVRYLIIGLSIIFFASSGIITLKALGIPAYSTPYQNNEEESNPKESPPEAKGAPEQLPEDRAGNSALVEELQATITGLKARLSAENKKTRAAEELQSTITTLEDKLSSRNGKSKEIAELQDTVAWLKFEISKKDAMIKEQTGSKRVKNEPKILAVLGAGAFSSGQTVINEDLINSVKELVPDILGLPDHHVVIEGHTDNVPIRLSAGRRYRDNMELSFLRAKAAADILVKNGIPLERISVIGYGDTRPITSNDTDEGRVRNRRVEVKLVPQDRGF